MTSTTPSYESLRMMLEIQWQDHFQTRAQTWKALQITVLMALGLVGVDGLVGSQAATLGAAVVVFAAAQLGVIITLRHRAVEIGKFRMIADLEKRLGLASELAKLPDVIHWTDIFRLKKINTPLYMLRMHILIQFFALGYAVFQLLF